MYCIIIVFPDLSRMSSRAEKLIQLPGLFFVFPFLSNRFPLNKPYFMLLWHLEWRNRNRPESDKALFSAC